MTVALDSTAAICLLLGNAASTPIARLVDGGDDVVVSALCRTEVSVALGESSFTEASAKLRADRLGELWERFWVVPVDQECLDLATDLAVAHRLPVAPAVHLAAFDRIERPLRLVSLDERQRAPAVSLGYEVVELAPTRSAHAMLEPAVL